MLAAVSGNVGAIDLGGTKILAAVVDSSGKVLAVERRPTGSTGPGPAIALMASALLQACADAGTSVAALAGLGVSAAGPVDIVTGVLSSPPNLPGWTDVPLASLLGDATGLSVVLENDANAAALSEHAFGAGRGARDMVYLTISTGIGGGIIVDGRLYHGATGAAGEIGHVVIVPNGPRCGCGRHGCLEALASGTAIAREGRRAAAEGQSAWLARRLRAGDEITAESVASAARNGDTTSRAILAEAATYLGMGLVVIVHLLNPERIVIGGGASKIGEPLLGPAEAYMREQAIASMSRVVKILPAAHTDNAGVLGAAALAFQKAGVEI